MSALFWTIRITSERYLIGIPPSMFCNANLKFLGHFQYNLSLIVLFFFFFLLILIKKVLIIKIKVYEKQKDLNSVAVTKNQKLLWWYISA